MCCVGTETSSLKQCVQQSKDPFQVGLPKGRRDPHRSIVWGLRSLNMKHNQPIDLLRLCFKQSFASFQTSNHIWLSCHVTKHELQNRVWSKTILQQTFQHPAAMALTSPSRRADTGLSGSPRCTWNMPPLPTNTMVTPLTCLQVLVLTCLWNCLVSQFTSTEQQ